MREKTYAECDHEQEGTMWEWHDIGVTSLVPAYKVLCSTCGWFLFGIIYDAEKKCTRVFFNRRLSSRLKEKWLKSLSKTLDDIVVEP